MGKIQLKVSSSNNYNKTIFSNNNKETINKQPLTKDNKAVYKVKFNLNSQYNKYKVKEIFNKFILSKYSSKHKSIQQVLTKLSKEVFNRVNRDKGRQEAYLYNKASFKLLRFNNSNRYNNNRLNNHKFSRHRFSNHRLNRHKLNNYKGNKNRTKITYK